MKINSNLLVDNLIAQCQGCKSEVQNFSNQELGLLNYKENKESWSVLECIQHLNLYSDFYLPEIKVQIEKSAYTSDELFKSGLLGNYSANMMLPGENMKKMKTFSNKNPLGSQLDSKVLERFIEHQDMMIELLNQSRSVSLNKTKTCISISKWIRLKLGDTFRFVINHQERHILQAKRTLVRAKQTSLT